MDDLIEALTILAKYSSDARTPTHCEHDILYVTCITETIPDKDFKRLEKLGFWLDDDDGENFWCSFRFGCS